MTEYDTIVVGGGIAGLSVSALLANEGQRILVLEQNNEVGGRAGTEDFKGWKLDEGMHGFAMGNKGTLGKILEKVGKSLELSEFVEESEIYEDGKFKDLAVFRESPDFGKILKKMVSMSTNEISRLTDISFKDWISKQTDDEELFKFFRSLSFFLTSLDSMEETAASSVLTSVNEHLEAHNKIAAYCYPIGGFESIGKSLSDYLDETNCEIRKNVKVSRILTKNSMVRGVKAQQTDNIGWAVPEKTEKIKAKNVVFTAPIWKIFNLIEENSFPLWFKNHIQSLKNNVLGGIGCFIGLKEPLYEGNKSRIIYEMPYGGGTHGGWMESNLDPTVAPKDYHLYVGHNFVKKEVIYDNIKLRKHLERMGKSLSTVYPDLQEKTEWIKYYAFPIVDGVVRSPHFVGSHLPDVKAPGVEGLYFAGDTVRNKGSGVESSASSAVLAAQKIEDSSELENLL